MVHPRVSCSVEVLVKILVVRVKKGDEVPLLYRTCKRWKPLSLLSTHDTLYALRLRWADCDSRHTGYSSSYCLCLCASGTTTTALAAFTSL